MNQDEDTSIKYTLAGPRKMIFHHPENVKAAIVTCGGLCPGLNVVIREIVMSLWFSYGVKDVVGIRWGYKGFAKQEEWVKLEPRTVKGIHEKGGTILGSDRGGFDCDMIIQALIDQGINQLYAIGGDGTHKAIAVLFDEIVKRKLKISLVGIPKTIDNDIPIIDKSFGFDTSCHVAAKIVNAANTEAESAPYCVGLVKVMGRDSGFIAA